MNKLYFSLVFLLSFSLVSLSQAPQMAKVDGGTYLPVYGTGDSIWVNSFFMDIHPVTNAQFLEFVRTNKQWQKSEVKRFFADDRYLQDWPSDLELGENSKAQWPVKNISWHAAKNYCECQGKRLPSVHEWEYAARANQNKPDAREDETYTKYILSWYETPKAYANDVMNTYENYWGIWDLHGLVWEWNQDFNSIMLVSDAVTPGAENAGFCDPGAVSTSDMIDYAAFMRFAFRSTQEAPYTSRNLGFRCVKDLE